MIQQYNFNDPLFLPSEGSRGFKTLCGLARHLGYDTSPQQLLNDDGTTVSSLIYMLEDNPGIIKANTLIMRMLTRPLGSR